MTLPARTITPAEADWPALLRAASDAPSLLHVRGAAVWNARRPAVAIVGSRAASGHGMARARDLAAELGRRGALVFSGGAVGIDAAAHLGALSVGAPTVAVLATGLGAPYPARHRPLFDAIALRGGALLTTFADGVPLRRWHFPRRNEVLAALCDAIVVVESRPASGTLYTAAAARRHGRVLAACPGTAGADALLAQGAALVESVDDLYAALDGRPRLATVAPPPPGSDAALALAALDPRDPRGADAVAVRAGLPAPRAIRALSSLELEGLALAVPGGRYVRSGICA